MWRFIKSAWNGEEKLIVVFWGGFAAFIACGFFLVKAAALFVDDESYIWLAAFLAFFALAIYLWWLTATWRCARNTSRPLWGYLALAFVLLLPLLRFIPG